MADLSPVIETMEHRWMRAWANGDVRTLKAITAKGFMLVTASTPPMVLDRPSWLEAAAKRYRCSSYRFREFAVVDHGAVAVLAGQLDLEATIDGHDWSGPVFVTDVWRKGTVRRGWKLVQRIVSKPDENPALPKAIRTLQLWK